MFSVKDWLTISTVPRWCCFVSSMFTQVKAFVFVFWSLSSRASQPWRLYLNSLPLRSPLQYPTCLGLFFFFCFFSCFSVPYILPLIFFCFILPRLSLPLPSLSLLYPLLCLFPYLQSTFSCFNKFSLLPLAQPLPPFPCFHPQCHIIIVSPFHSRYSSFFLLFPLFSCLFFFFNHNQLHFFTLSFFFLPLPTLVLPLFPLSLHSRSLHLPVLILLLIYISLLSTTFSASTRFSGFRLELFAFICLSHGSSQTFHASSLISVSHSVSNPSFICL